MALVKKLFDSIRLVQVFGLGQCDSYFIPCQWLLMFGAFIVVGNIVSSLVDSCFFWRGCVVFFQLVFGWAAAHWLFQDSDVFPCIVSCDFHWRSKTACKVGEQPRAEQEF